MRFMTDDLWRSYEDWLLNLIHVSTRGYLKLFDQLHDKQYTYVIPMDENRASDGISLREDFYREMRLEEAVFDHRDDCSVLEMLVALSIRIDSEYTGDPLNERPDGVFWELLCNMDLDQFPDSNYDHYLVNDILDQWLNREFAYNGDGSPFPICRPRKDQRYSELWSQMMEYLSERAI